VHLEGNPSEIGFQHGYLLSSEIKDSFKRPSPVEMTHDEKKGLGLLPQGPPSRSFWPHVEQEYRDELNGIVEGLKAKNVKLDLWDIVAPQRLARASLL